MLPDTPAAAILWLSTRFFLADATELAAMDRAMKAADYELLMATRALAEERAYTDGRELPSRGAVAELARFAQESSLADSSPLAELALHYGLVAVGARDLLTPAQYAVLLTPLASGLAYGDHA